MVLGTMLSLGNVEMSPAGPLPSQAPGHRGYESEDYPAPGVHEALWEHLAGVSGCCTRGGWKKQN